MQETETALRFLSQYLYNKLPRRRVDQLLDILKTELLDRFQDHWYPEDPELGTAYRCLTFDDSLDPVVLRCARRSGIPGDELLATLPSDLHIWIDPASVSYRSGDIGGMRYLLPAQKATSRESPPSRSKYIISTSNSYLQETGNSPASPCVPCILFKYCASARNVNGMGNNTLLGGKIMLDCDADETDIRHRTPQRRRAVSHRDGSHCFRKVVDTEQGKLSQYC